MSYFSVFLLINKRKQCMSRRGGLVLVPVKRSAPHGSMVAPLLSAIEPTHIVPTPTSLLSTRHLHHLSSQNIVFLFLHSTLNKGPAIICNWQRRDKTEPDDLFSFRQSDNRQSEQHQKFFAKHKLKSEFGHSSLKICVRSFAQMADSIYPMPF